MATVIRCLTPSALVLEGCEQKVLSVVAGNSPFSSFPLVSFLFSPFPSPSFPSLILQAIIPNNWVLNIFYVYQSKVILSSSWYSNHIRVAKVP